MIEILQEIETHILVYGCFSVLLLGFIALALNGIRHELKKLNKRSE